MEASRRSPRARGDLLLPPPPVPIRRPDSRTPALLPVLRCCSPSSGAALLHFSRLPMSRRHSALSPPAPTRASTWPRPQARAGTPCCSPRPPRLVNDRTPRGPISAMVESYGRPHGHPSKGHGYCTSMVLRQCVDDGATLGRQQCYHRPTTMLHLSTVLLHLSSRCCKRQTMMLSTLVGIAFQHFLLSRSGFGDFWDFCYILILCLLFSI
jgi:hypothetical protein